MLHHTMEPGMDHAIYVGMAAPVRKAYTVLMDEKTMAQEIDRVIEEGVLSRLPVYIYVPMDVASVQLDAKRLKIPLKTEVTNSNKEMEDEIVKSALESIKSASAPAILADVLTIRHGGKKLAEKLMNLTKFPTYSTPLGKGVVDETSPYFNGLYNGEGNRFSTSCSKSRADKTL
jgi:pyruvate decarboxylase